jgi:hypothetical protein
LFVVLSAVQDPPQQPCPVAQVVPHAPQLATSVCKFLQREAAAFPQHVWPPVQATPACPP